MSCTLLNGYCISEKIDEIILERIINDKNKKLKGKFKEKKLFIIYSKNIANYSYLYIILKKSIYLNSDVIFILIRINKDVSENKLKDIIQKISRKRSNSSIIILSPLSCHINKCYISKYIKKCNDIDGVNYKTILELIKSSNNIVSYNIPHSFLTLINYVRNSYIKIFNKLLKFFFTSFFFPLKKKEEISKKIDTENNSINNKVAKAQKGNYEAIKNMLFCYNKKQNYEYSDESQRKYDILLHNYLKNIKYSIPCCVYSILLFIKYYNINIKNKNILIINNNINIFLSLFILFFRNKISTIVYDAVKGNILCRYKKNDKNKFYFKINNRKLLIKDEEDFKSKCNNFMNYHVVSKNQNRKFSKGDIKKNMKKKIIKFSDIIIIGLGCSNILKKKHVKRNAIILDLGINLKYCENNNTKFELSEQARNNTNKYIKENNNGNFKNDTYERKDYNYLQRNFLYGNKYVVAACNKRKRKSLFSFRKTKIKLKVDNNTLLPSSTNIKLKKHKNNIYMKIKERNRNSFYKLPGTIRFKTSSIKYENVNRYKEKGKRKNFIYLKTNKSKLEFSNKLSKFLVNYEIIGDVDLNCKKKCQYISSVPGGLGPITTSILFYNLYFKKVY
ncbi:bifunctional methylenetetrahydrofolate dehydrogenase/cyclohydrolase, putative [Plasmodium gallinaceum]|uniref:Bifunctional methylenetetrahydrofolate dehydrogenase/cyclohydrolase, putative n=1 Tax=Plasmodium gallinaceum TaxID=5849 RepID=A0A1J1GNI9_PLAGA|nr:bifunctional methylenetetrahydrofolate dehydrogenase/cyclohydrolase, putative [Plasmodium gallinaceum]CRG93884.1 bifunctional methylenetetrahydrofolate dehydrogenase/cyclohydrolase, putative [Plasmodium gallinaceum]